MNDNVKRTATIIAKTDCQFAVMEKNDYKSILGAIEMAKVDLKLSFLHSFPFLKSWSVREIETFSYHWEQKDFSFNQFVYK